MKFFVVLVVLFLAYSQSKSTKDEDAEAAIKLGLQRVDIGTGKAGVDSDYDDYYYDDDADDDNADTTNITAVPTIPTAAAAVDGQKRPFRTINTSATTRDDATAAPVTNVSSSNSSISSSKPHGLLNSFVNNTEKLLNKIFPSKTSTGEKAPTDLKPNIKVKKDVDIPNSVVPRSTYAGHKPKPNAPQKVYHPPITADDKLSLLQMKAAADKIETELDNIDLENRGTAAHGVPSRFQGFMPTKEPTPGQDAKEATPDLSGHYQGFNPYDSGPMTKGVGMNPPNVVPSTSQQQGTVSTADTKSAANWKPENGRQVVANKSLETQKTKVPAKGPVNIRAATYSEATKEIPKANVEASSSIVSDANSRESGVIDKRRAGQIEPLAVWTPRKQKQLTKQTVLIQNSIDSLNGKLDSMLKTLLITNSDTLKTQTAAIEANTGLIKQSEKKIIYTIADFQENSIKLLEKQRKLQKKLALHIEHIMSILEHITKATGNDQLTDMHGTASKTSIKQSRDNSGRDRNNKHVEKTASQHKDQIPYHPLSGKTVNTKHSDTAHTIKQPGGGNVENINAGVNEAKLRKTENEGKNTPDKYRTKLHELETRKKNGDNSKLQQPEITSNKKNNNNISKPHKSSEHPHTIAHVQKASDKPHITYKSHGVYPENVGQTVTANSGGKPNKHLEDALFEGSKPSPQTASEERRKPFSAQIATGDIELGEGKAAHQKRNAETPDENNDNYNELTDEEIDEILLQLINEDKDQLV